MDWLDLFAVQGTLKSLLQHHSSKASILQHSAFFRVQLSYPYMTTGKIIALTRRTFVGKVMCLFFNMLSRLVITFLPRSKCLLILMAAVTICSDFGAQKNKIWHCFHYFPIYFPWSDGTRCHDLSFLKQRHQNDVKHRTSAPVKTICDHDGPGQKQIHEVIMPEHRQKGKCSLSQKNKMTKHPP